jgi:manganese/zinc/iron transport system permease protein
VLGVAAAALGHLGAIVVPAWFGFPGTSTSGMMAVATGLLFVLVWLFGPRHGVLLPRRINRKGDPPHAD